MEDQYWYVMSHCRIQRMAPTEAEKLGGAFACFGILDDAYRHAIHVKQELIASRQAELKAIQESEIQLVH